MTPLDRMYQARFAVPGLEKRRRVWETLCRSFFSRYVPRDGAVLDIACGYGEFINHIEAGRKFAVDLNPDTAQHLGPGILHHHGPANDLGFLQDDSLDAAFTSNFLEHLPDKAACLDIFAEVFRTLKPGGRFIVLGPNIKYAADVYWDFFDHTLPLSHLSLAEGLALAGFEVETVIPRFLPYTMNGRLPVHPIVIQAYLLLRPAWRIFGKQFLVTAVKPRSR